MIKRIAAAAILMCAVMVLVAGAPLVTADTHHIVKGAQGPRASAVSWKYTPTETGVWNGHVVNSGLKSLVVDVEDITTGAASSVLHQRIRFAATGNTLDTANVTMAKNHIYNITATPNGPKGTSCTVDDMYVIPTLPVAMFTVSVNGATVNVDGSASYDLNVGQTITAWGWEWGDGSPASTGVTASHTYTVSKTYTITLTVLSSTGMTGSTSHDVVADTPPVPAFTASSTSWALSVDASASTDNQPIVSYAWDFGDSTTGTGKVTTHTYTASGTYNVKLTVTDTIGQTGSLTKAVIIRDDPPVAAFTATPNMLVVSVDASASTDNQPIVSYAWNWGDGSALGSGVAATHTYLGSGTYPITLTVKDTVGQTSSVSHDVLVNGGIPAPVASFTATVRSNGYTVAVNGTNSTSSAGALSYSWNWGDMITQAGVTATHTYVTNGVYTITLTVKDTIGQTNSVSHDVSISNVPIPPTTFLLYGTTFASDGVTPLGGCTITITDVTTGTTLIGTVSGDDGTYYNDISPLFPSAGDTIIVNAIGPAGQTGSGTGVLIGQPYLGINVILT